MTHCEYEKLRIKRNMLRDLYNSSNTSYVKLGFIRDDIKKIDLLLTKYEKEHELEK